MRLFVFLAAPRGVPFADDDENLLPVLDVRADGAGGLPGVDVVALRPVPLRLDGDAVGALGVKAREKEVRPVVKGVLRRHHDVLCLDGDAVFAEDGIDLAFLEPNRLRAADA